MRDDLTIIYAHTVEAAINTARGLGLSKDDIVCIGRKSAGIRGFQARTGRVILVGDVQLQDKHRTDIAITFDQPFIKMFRVKQVGYVN